MSITNQSHYFTSLQWVLAGALWIGKTAKTKNCHNNLPSDQVHRPISISRILDRYLACHLDYLVAMPITSITCHIVEEDGGFGEQGYGELV